MTDLTTLFRQSGGAPVIYQGQVVQPSIWLPISLQQDIRLRVVKCTKTPVQGIQLVARAKRGKPGDARCQVEIAGRTGTEFVLWTDTAPEVIPVRIVNALSGSQIGIWNVWRHPHYDTMLYGLNNAAIQVLSSAADYWLLGCSDGIGEPDFEDLVLEIRIL